MKKTLLVIALGLSTLFTMAQAGSWYIGGIAGFQNKSTKAPVTGFKTSTTDWVVGPEVGTFLNEKIQLGVVLSFSGSKEKNDNGDLSSSFSMSPSLYGRYFFKVSDNLSTFAGLYFNYISNNTTEYLATNVETKQSGIGVRLGIGLAYALSPKFTVVGQYGLCGFESLSEKVNGTDSGSSSNFDFGVNTVGGSVFNVGLYYTFLGGSK